MHHDYMNVVKHVNIYQVPKGFLQQDFYCTETSEVNNYCLHRMWYLEVTIININLCFTIL